MTGQENARLREVLKTVVSRILRERDHGMNEENTKNGLIDPVLEALGWNIHDNAEVDREFRARAGGNPVDYALKIQCKPKLFIEAKGLGEHLDDPKWTEQVLFYATTAVVDWCVLTNGDEYRFYNATARGKPDEKEFRRVKLSEPDEDKAVDALAPLSHSDLDGRLIEDRWTEYFVDRRVKVALQELLNGPEEGLLKLILRKVNDLSRTEIKASFDRQKPRIEFRPPTPRPPTETGDKEVPETDRTSLAQLVQAGIVPVSTKLFARYKETDFEATVLPDGGVEFKGTRYSTPSAAAVAAKSVIAGKKMSTDGWDFWQVRDGGGKVRKLGDLRNASGSKEA
jgi:hypothetical protein